MARHIQRVNGAGTFPDEPAGTKKRLMFNGRTRRTMWYAALATCVGSLGLLAIVALGAQPSSGSASTVTSAPTTTLPPCPPNLPPGVTCDPQAIAAARASAQSQAQENWPAQSSTYLSESQAEAAAETWNPASSGYPAHGQQMTYGQAAALVGESPNPSVNPDTNVWVVTVDAPPGDGWYRQIPGEASPSSYTVILDAANGSAIDICSPCMAQITAG